MVIEIFNIKPKIKPKIIKIKRAIHAKITFFA